MGKYRVLIVDDDPSLTRLLKYRLENRDRHQVYTASSGQEALDLALEINPHLILLDWSMPGLSGLEVLSRLKRQDTTRHIPVVMLTGRNLIGELEQAFTLGADGYQVKPVRLELFSEKVKSILASRRVESPSLLKRWLSARYSFEY